IIEETKPKYAIAENVKNLVSKKFATEFEIVLDALDEAGYNNYWKVLNTKDFGIPQNRERVFIVSIRKDIDKGFEFPEGFPLELRLKDVLEDEVDEKYYLDDTRINMIQNWKAQQRPLSQVLGNESTCRTLTARGAGEWHSGMILYSNQLEDTTNVEEIKLPGAYGRSFGSRGKLQDLDGTCQTLVSAMGTGGGNVPIVVGQAHKCDSQSGKVYSMEGISPTMVAGTHGYAMGYIEVKEGTKKGYTEATEGDSINLGFPSSTTRRGRVGHQVSQTLDTSCNMGVVENLRIRKLTPKECWRLQGFDDESFERAAKVNSNTQLYKQAGNSITVKVLEYLFKALFKEVI
ncbi:MAG: DNA cytosine methyltransferase, partial [Clostridia bacterium]|nr:DNA cytosine methyltransferase [Clostridia bacterium]